MFQVEESSKKKFYQIFERTEKMVTEDIQTIKNWITTQPHLPETMGDTQIRNFLHVNKFSVEKTKQKIDMYYTMRGLLPELFLNPKNDRIQTMLDSMFFGISPKLLDGLHRVYFWKWKGPNFLRGLDEINIFFASYELRLFEDFVTDDFIIIDWSDVTLSDMKKCTPSLMHKLFNTYQKMFSMRLYKVYYINCPSYVSIFLAIVKSLLKPKIFDRIRAFEDDGVLKETFPMDELPEDYGGSGPSLRELTDLLKQKLEEYQDRFDFLANLKVDESLRPEKLDNNEILGFYGNFKKLDVD